MQINAPRNFSLASRPIVAASASQPPTAPPPKETLVQKAAEELADVIVFLGKIPILGKVGVWLLGQVTKPTASQPALGNFGTLGPNLLRGAQPTDAGIQQLAQQGVNTVINLRPEYDQEGPAVQRNGMKYLYMPLPPIGAPTIDQGLQFLSAVTDPANGKVFFHCQHGADRTGAMAAIYRIAHDGWTADQAIAEMPRYGFHAGIEDEKIVFVRQFAQQWAALPQAQKAQVLHTGLNATA